MTQLTQGSDMELREQLLRIDTVYDYGSGRTAQFLPPNFYIDRLVEFIQADKQLSIDRAILDELKRLDDDHQTTSQDLEREKPGYTAVCVPCEPIWKRIAELEQQLSPTTTEEKEMK